MWKFLRFIIPLILLVIGAYCFLESYQNYGNFREWATLDPSGAELYELNFQLFTPPAFVFSILGSFLAGRWWFR